MSEKHPYIFYPKLIIRTPRHALPKEVNETLLKHFFAESIEKEAIYLASPVLYDALITWQNGKELNTKEHAKLIHSLSKYYLRASTRPTPFGLFSGLATICWGDTTDICIQNKIERHTRLDMNYLCELALNLSQNPIIREKFGFRLNSSAYIVSGEIRYVEYYYEYGQRKHQISSIKNDFFIKKLLKFVGNEGKQYFEMVQFLTKFDIEELEAKKFIGQLIDMQLFNSGFEPAVTGPEFMKQIIQLLNQINDGEAIEINEIVSVLKEIDENLYELDANFCNKQVKYAEIIQLIEKLGAKYDPNFLFQTDLKILSKAQSCLNSKFQAEIVDVIDFLRKIDISNGNSNTKNFIDKFRERYQDQEVPLIKVLDPEAGIGYLDKTDGDFTPLIEGIDFSTRKNSNFSLSKNQQLLFETLIEANRNQSKQIDIQLINFEKDELDAKPLSSGFNIMARLFENDQLFIESMGGSSVAHLLGRFGHADEQVSELIKWFTDQEKNLNPDVIFAEILHLPENRIGNVLLHPHFLDYEIPFLAKSTLPIDNQLNINDLTLKLVGDRFILKSKKYNKIVIPRLSNAHNYSNDALPIYQFLCDLQHQGLSQSISFSWGSIANGFRYLPRVVYKNTLLSLAQWHYYKFDLQAVNAIFQLKTFLKTQNIPRLFYLADGDNELLIDAENDLLLEILLKNIQKKELVIFKEYLPYSQAITKEGPPNTLANQLIIPVLNTNLHYKNLNKPKVSSIKKDFSFGEEWLYFKIYSGSKTANEVLISSISKCVKVFRKQKLIKSWFFIRYGDPHPHLRLRFQLTDNQHIQTIIEFLNKALAAFIKNKQIWKIQTDTYERELDRYNHDLIIFHERIFQASSDASLQYLLKTKNMEISNNSWLFAMGLIIAIVEAFEISMLDRISLFEKLKEAFAKEFEFDKNKKLLLDQKYRDNKLIINRFMNNSDNEFALIIKEFAIEIGHPSKEILKAKIKKEAIIDSLSSQIHMIVNRQISSSQRQHELIIYDFLYRYYRTELALLKN